jgi:hypothetical protein
MQTKRSSCPNLEFTLATTKRLRLHPVDTPEKKLGVYVCLMGDFTYHVDQLRKTGLEYASRLQARNPLTRDCWMGTWYQLYPKLIYGAVALTHNPDKLEAVFQLVWYSLLPSLKVNRHITKEFCMRPLWFQGLALPNPNIDVLSSKIHLIQKHWGRPGDIVGDMLAAAYLVFQNEVGIRGKVLLWPFEKYGALATHGFFRNLWQLLSKYGVSLRLPRDSSSSVLRIDDRPLMEAVIDTSIFSTAELVAINRFCHHKRVHSIGDMVCCDGLTIKPSMFTMTKGRSSLEFPCQRPTRAQLNLWKHAVGSITISGIRLRTPLGAFTTDSHRPDKWFTNADGSHICCSQYAHNFVMQTGTPHMRNLRPSSPYAYGESPYAYGDQILMYQQSFLLSRVETESCACARTHSHKKSSPYCIAHAHSHQKSSPHPIILIASFPI